MLQTQPFEDRLLTCSDCAKEFVFTAGEQFFFHDKQFKNDPKRCKPCKARRSGLSAAANGASTAHVALSRTETRTECSECGVQTTVPFKPTQGRPVLCRGCFQMKGLAAKSAGIGPNAVPAGLPAGSPAAIPVIPSLPIVSEPSAYALAEAAGQAQTISALAQASIKSNGAHLSAEAATLAAASMAGASANSSVATAVDLAAVVQLEKNMQATQMVAQTPAQAVAAPVPAIGGLPVDYLARRAEAQPGTLLALPLEERA